MVEVDKTAQVNVVLGLEGTQVLNALDVIVDAVHQFEDIGLAY